jgi:putative hydrolase
VYGCERAAACGVEPDRVINTRSADELLAWTADKASA